MDFVLFDTVCPEVAREDNLTIEITDSSNPCHLPKGYYSFFEFYCQTIDCDCCHVMMDVFNRETSERVAVLRYGWRSQAFYQDLAKRHNELVWEAFYGPQLAANSPHTSVSQGLLSLFAKLIQGNPDYVEQLQRHYYQFKETVSQQACQTGLVGDGETVYIQPDSLCPCGSGQPYEACCLKKSPH